MSMTSPDKLYSVFLKHRNISTDSRNILPGSIFFALKGDNFNGNTFALQALESGAAFAVIDDPEIHQNERMLLVDNVLESLQKLAIRYRSDLSIPIIGITGTNGKTTTKELIHAVLSTQMKAHSTTGNLNNHIGVPLTMLGISPDTEIAVIEMGANHPGEIGLLCNIARPGYGIITNIGKAHLEGFGSFEGVVKTKSELYHFIKDNKGLLFVNSDNSLLLSLAEGVDMVKYGKTSGCSIRGKLFEADPYVMLEYSDHLNTYRVDSNILGEYNFENILAAITIGNYFGISPENIRTAIQHYTPSNSRSEALNTANNFVILDAYNANPTSMKAALLNFGNMKAERKMVILGGMKELGAESLAEHRAIVQLVKEMNFEDAIFAGPEFLEIARELGFTAFRDSKAALEFLKLNPVKEFSILVKGSRGSRMEVLVEAL